MDCHIILVIIQCLNLYIECYVHSAEPLIVLQNEYPWNVDNLKVNLETDICLTYDWYFNICVHRSYE